MHIYSKRRFSSVYKFVILTCYMISYEELMRARFKNWSMRSRQLAAMLSWAIWRDWNDLVWNQRNKPTKEVVALANSDPRTMDLCLGKNFYFFIVWSSTRGWYEHWSVPIGNKIKVNIDATISEERRSFGMGWVARNFDGMVVEARTSCKPAGEDRSGDSRSYWREGSPKLDKKY